MPLFSKEGRRIQAIAELDALKRELDQWHKDWTVSDSHEDGTPRGQYKTQLGAIYSEVSATAEILRKGLADIDLSAGVCTVYGEFSRLEREILWLWRIWYFFRDKLQQRNDERFGKILRAADEVVWSCHRPFFELPSLKQVKGPAPLPWIRPDFSPKALRRDQRQALDRKDDDFRLVQEAFRELPVPILDLPITAVNNPWALVLIGHEAGHFVEPLLAPKFNETFARVLAETVTQANGSDDDRQSWYGWADEIFADLYSVLTMGPWAVWAIAQFEIGHPSEMQERRFVYPSPYVRLKLISALAQRYGVGAELAGIPQPPADDSIPDELARDLGVVDSMADAITAMSEIRALAAALPFQKLSYVNAEGAARTPEVEQWSRHLQGSGASPPLKQLRSARLAAAGTAKAWSEKIFVQPSSEALRSELREQAIAKIAASGPLDSRSSVAAPKPKAEPGRALFDVLKRAESILAESNARPN